MTLQVGFSLMLTEDFRRATAPLFEAGEVDVLEWSFDTAWSGTLPVWAEALLADFSTRGRLLGHGVTFSVLSAEWTPRQEAWLGMLSAETVRRQYRHVSEHFGFMAGGDFHQGVPLPVPLCEETLRVGREGLARLAAACHLPVGLEIWPSLSARTMWPIKGDSSRNYSRPLTASCSWTCTTSTVRRVTSTYPARS